MAYARIAAQPLRNRTPRVLPHAGRSRPEHSGGRAHYDQPFGNSSALPAVLLRAARESGTASKSCWRETAATSCSEETPATRSSEYSRRMPPTAVGSAQNGRHRAAAARRCLARGACPSCGRPWAMSDRRGCRCPTGMNTYNLLERLGVDARCSSPSSCAQVDVDDADAAAARGLFDACNGRSLVNAMLAYDWKYTLADNDLPKVCGHRGARGRARRVSVARRRDRRLLARPPGVVQVEGLAAAVLLQGGPERVPARAAIIAKKKHGFGLPFGAWLTRHAGLRDLGSRFSRPSPTRGIVRPSFLEALMEQKRRRAPRASTARWCGS